MTFLYDIYMQALYQRCIIQVLYMTSVIYMFFTDFFQMGKQDRLITPLSSLTSDQFIIIHRVFQRKWEWQMCLWHGWWHCDKSHLFWTFLKKKQTVAWCYLKYTFHIRLAWQHATLLFVAGQLPSLSRVMDVLPWRERSHGFQAVGITNHLV